MQRACAEPEDAGAAGACSELEPGRLCVRGELTSSGEQLRVGDELKLTVYPKGCFSSSCTRVETASSSVGAGFKAQAEFCLADVKPQNGGCTPDCSGGRFADCQSSTGLTAGTHTVELGSLRVEFNVPSSLAAGGQCSGMVF
jgi:hypothetical protein